MAHPINYQPFIPQHIPDHDRVNSTWMTLNKLKEKVQLVVGYRFQKMLIEPYEMIKHGCDRIIRFIFITGEEKPEELPEIYVVEEDEVVYLGEGEGHPEVYQIEDDVVENNGKLFILDGRPECSICSDPIEEDAVAHFSTVKDIEHVSQSGSK